ncbi:hypothetical protein Rcae01_04843 [Novipirellula caenicola]|uniref:Uncharacterized protein n=1 Tax=Novipirellula caenicola TaxID=1536901 RepID=A0ABP9VW26_9BACT
MSEIPSMTSFEIAFFDVLRAAGSAICLAGLSRSE